jgi:predicted enzyme related to lactoylglutathione lyase
MSSPYKLDPFGNNTYRYALVLNGGISIMLKKIDCVMIKVDDLPAAQEYYTEVFGLNPLWGDDSSIGLGFRDTDTEIVLHTNQDIPSQAEVFYLVDNVNAAVTELQNKDCVIIVEPFDISMGKCAVIRDPFGIRLCILDMTKGPRENNLDI